jgi:hypothetical protein
MPLKAMAALPEWPSSSCGAGRGGESPRRFCLLLCRRKACRQSRATKGVVPSFGNSFAPLEFRNVRAGRRPARSDVSEESRSNPRGPCRIGAGLVFQVAPAASGPAWSPAVCARWWRFIYHPLRS